MQCVLSVIRCPEIYELCLNSTVDDPASSALRRLQVMIKRLDSFLADCNIVFQFLRSVAQGAYSRVSCVPLVRIHSAPLPFQALQATFDRMTLFLTLVSLLAEVVFGILIIVVALALITDLLCLDFLVPPLEYKPVLVRVLGIERPLARLACEVLQ